MAFGDIMYMYLRNDGYVPSEIMKANVCGSDTINCDHSMGLCHSEEH